jgi:predicted phosphoribosyltransferase
VGYEIANALGAPLDILTVRKLGVPGHEELGFGAIARGGVRVLNEDLIRGLRISDRLIEHTAAVEGAELERRERLYRGGREPIDVRGRTVILVDDGLATGATMFAAVAALRKLGAASIVVAVPVASREACAALRKDVTECVCAMTPVPFLGVGVWYDDFSQTTDREVSALLATAHDHPTDARDGAGASSGGRS